MLPPVPSHAQEPRRESVIPAWFRMRPTGMPDELLWAVGVSYTGSRANPPVN
ncbi:hypothetical protein [Actinoplanes utahensis]|uniref:hypothetical protein n=1 Tax=Actinoplanes utahensis TaxID=1869 RepID=UPI000AE7C392|nr:hypothetical protein [Actinoplanes utahensis]GIF30364.1 hypothetical protein Aut01nite_33500 [Actinoplanes utahensis]